MHEFVYTYMCACVYERDINNEIPGMWGNQLLCLHMPEQQQIF